MIKICLNLSSAPRRQHMLSLSNMPLARVDGEGEDWEWDVYQPTVAMSTYLIAFVVCEFKFVEQQVLHQFQATVYNKTRLVSKLGRARRLFPRASTPPGSPLFWLRVTGFPKSPADV